MRPDSSRADKEAAMNEYNSIAFNYEDQGDFVTASYFYQKVVELANSCKVRVGLCRIDSSNWWLCWAWESVMIKGKKETVPSRSLKTPLTTQVLWSQKSKEVRWSG